MTIFPLAGSASVDGFLAVRPGIGDAVGNLGTTLVAVAGAMLLFL